MPYALAGAFLVVTAFLVTDFLVTVWPAPGRLVVAIPIVRLSCDLSRAALFLWMRLRLTALSISEVVCAIVAIEAVLIDFRKVTLKRALASVRYCAWRSAFVAEDVFGMSEVYQSQLIL